MLLDTCIVYDWLMGAIADRSAIAAIRESDARVSPVSVWEMAIKHRLGKLALPTTALVEAIAAQGFRWLPVQPAHAEAVIHLPDHHRDPFDRLLIAQSAAEGMRIATYDAVFSAYLPDTWLVPRSRRPAKS